MKFAESTVETAALEWFGRLGYQIASGPDLLPDGASPERDSASDVVLSGRLRAAMQRINPSLAIAAIDEALRKLATNDAVLLVDRNHRMHDALVNGVDVEYQKADGTIGYDKAWLIDFDDLERNDFLAVNQFTVVNGQYHRRPDIVVFINGLPVAVIELKNAADEDADIEGAFLQIQTYKDEIPAVFDANEICVISDGSIARVGSLTADYERFGPWRTISGEHDEPKNLPQLEVLIKGLFEKSRLLDYIRHFIVFEDDGATKIKKVAGYHQFHAVREAVASTVRAVGPVGTRRAGVVWHTQGSGKSLTMVFYAGKLVLSPELKNPTIVLITDRNDLDNQLFETFAHIRRDPQQAEDREDLRAALRVASGGIVFTTIQKFLPEESRSEHPLLSDRSNVIVIADEAHRTQYGFRMKVNPNTGEVTYGLAKYLRDALPNATFIGFTGTPIEKTDANTRQVFGDYISIYDIQRAVEDRATVPIFYESRLAKIELDPGERPHLDPEFEEVTEGEELSRKEQLKTKWAALEKIVGADKRVKLIAADIVKHWEQRLSAMEGKAMIVCMSRRICIDLYNEIVKLRPEWHSDDDLRGAVKIVMTASADEGPEYAKHARSKARRKEIEKRFKSAEDPMKIVIVRDMWLTGFDVPPLHTMYVDKPLTGHNLMQAIARVNRVFRNKPGGLVVDYLGLAENLKKAVANYTAEGGKGETAIDVEQAAAEMTRRYEICRDLFHGFDWTRWTTGRAVDQMRLVAGGADFILSIDRGKERLLDAVMQLSTAFALALPHERAISIRDDVGFFQAVRAALVKTAKSAKKPPSQVDFAIRQIVSKAIVSDEVIDVFAAAGLKRPDLSILSDDFLAEVREIPQKNLAVELLKKLLDDELKRRSRKNLVQSRSFEKLLEQRLREYHNRALTTVEILEKLIEVAREMNAASRRGEDLGLTEDEMAFYDALETNDSAVAVLGDETLRDIARELVQTVKNNVTIDWTVRESVQANLRRLVKRILRKYGYPPDKQEKATSLVLEQAALHAEWAT